MVKSKLNVKAFMEQTQKEAKETAEAFVAQTTATITPAKQAT